MRTALIDIYARDLGNITSQINRHGFSIVGSEHSAHENTVRLRLGSSAIPEAMDGKLVRATVHYGLNGMTATTSIELEIV